MAGSPRPTRAGGVGGPSRRTVVAAGLGLATAAAAVGGGRAGAAPAPAMAVTGSKVRNLTGPDETGQFAAPWTDLGIPARCPDGTMLFVCGDTFDGDGVG